MFFSQQLKMFKKNKKGSHVDVIVSFVIFLVFVGFMFVLIKPAADFNGDKTQAAEGLKLNIEDLTKAEITLVNIVNTSSKSGDDCISLNSALDFSNLEFIVKDYNGNTVDAKSSTDLEISWAGDSGFFKVYYSDNKFNSHVSGDSFSCQTGEIKSIQEIQEYVEKDIVQLISNLATNYSGIKEDLSLSVRDDFWLRFEYSNGTIIGEEVDSKKTNIYAEKYQINYLDFEANKKSGYFILYVW